MEDNIISAGDSYCVITAAVVGLTAAFAKAKRSRRTSKSTREMQKLEGIEKLAEQYETLSDKIDKTEEETARLVDIKRQLAEQFPEIIDGMDEEGNVTEINNDLLRESIELKREEINLKREDLAASLKRDL